MKMTSMSLHEDLENGATQSVRAMTCEVSLLSQPDGSALFNQGNSSALVAVYGPAEVKMSKELIDRATVEVIYKPKVGLPGCETKQVEQVVRTTCEGMARVALHPRSLCSIIVQEMQDTGSFLACCLNATCLALLDASYQLNYMCAAVACAHTEQGKLVLDPTAKQEKDCSAHFTFVFESVNKELVACYSKGLFSTEQYQTAFDTCRKASEQIFLFYKDSLKKKLSKIK